MVAVEGNELRGLRDEKVQQGRGGGVGEREGM